MQNERMEIHRERGRRGCLRTYRKLNFPRLVSHITQHAAGRDPLFVEQDDYLMMLGLIKACAESFKIRILAFCLMTNHIHILLRQATDNLPDALKSLFQTYAVRFNRRYGRSGHLFKSAYRQLACFDDAYVISNSLYIHLNPVRAGMTNHYGDYPWSSWKLYCRADAPEAFVDSSIILRLLGRTQDEQVAKYRSLLDQARASGSRKMLPEASAGFALKLWQARAGGNFQIHSGGGFINAAAGPGETNLPASDKALEFALKTMALSGGFKGLNTPAAKLFTVEQLEARGYRLEEICGFLNVSRQTVRRLKRRGSSRKN